MPERCPECHLLGGHLDECSRIPAATKYTPPNDLRSAAYAIAAIAFFYTAPLGLLLWKEWRDPMPGFAIDTFGRVAFACIGALIVLFWMSSVLLLLRRRAGVYLWWICSPVVILNFPIGTLTALYIVRRLRSPAAQAELQSRSRSA